MKRMARMIGVTMLGTIIALGTHPITGWSTDFGTFITGALQFFAPQLFGVEAPLEASAPPSTAPYRQPSQNARAQVRLAPGLQVAYLTRRAANATDMMAFFPATNPTHLITCVEGDREVIGQLPGGGDKYNPSVQRISLANGRVQTILRGMEGCDGIRTTPWGTILATEETNDGGAYEILEPLDTTEETVLDRAVAGPAGTSNPQRIRKRSALPTMAWEGLAILPNGVIIAGDELRPGTAEADTDGGALFKFIPDTPRDPSSGPITALNQSPLTRGQVFALQVSCQSTTQQVGQGCEIGNAAWIPVRATRARADANANGATGYYRPEDLHEDPLFHDPDNAEAVRVCWANTGNEAAANYGEVVCAVDSAPLTASATTRTVVVNRFVEGDTDFNSFDNLAFQPVTGNLYVIEDHPNGDIFACLPDGNDRDIKTDGCIKILSVRDSSAEPTGFLFSPDGTTAYLSIQHSDDTLVPSVDDYPTDDILIITGFQVNQP